ncbi:bifunctional helix-turn-helix transcriptional regulator/GNAT family N-acetyltransferase [Nonomuraea rubra]|uniref:DNA-binding MarR family transcriptional regulator/GNAT superfamily N-acetyltransferase n=1 Tax=Nonomuraea rubra TaxID=46180 RepID=A0A7X0NQC4_9ACTN|nr:helix-turn-helix domain-containing GNAT family N-acetyltransferase [Nonomuraea rubra]MBB6547677.1 DNA-binding MarR family transcriptional regulator/GNAT superfamily N-acetyltransferase [Nonomuraea rubra]
MDATAIARVRRFQRTVTQRIGALEDAFMGRDRPLGQARLLWEIGTEGSELRALRARLDLDSGYLSRLLRALEADGLVVVEAAGPDGRVRTARLTPAGAAEWQELDRRSDEAAASMLARLPTERRERLVAAMSEVERLLAASMVEIGVLDPGHPGARHCLAAYVAELGRRFESGFDPARSLPATDDELRPPAGMLLVATLHAEPVGCVALKLHPGSATAELKRMWVAPSARGLGLGRMLLAEAESRAAGHGVRTLRLETNRALTEAIALYRSSGYSEVPAFSDERYAHHWFEKHLPG